MLFVSVHELVPMARRYRQPGWFILGMLLGAADYGFLAILTSAMGLS